MNGHNLAQTFRLCVGIIIGILLMMVYHNNKNFSHREIIEYIQQSQFTQNEINDIAHVLSVKKSIDLTEKNLKNY